MLRVRSASAMPLSMVAVLAGFLFSLGADALTLPARAPAACVPKRAEFLTNFMPQVVYGEKVTSTNFGFDVLTGFGTTTRASGELGNISGVGGDEISRDLERFGVQKSYFGLINEAEVMCQDLNVATLMQSLTPGRQNLLMGFRRITPRSCPFNQFLGLVFIPNPWRPWDLCAGALQAWMSKKAPRVWRSRLTYTYSKENSLSARLAGAGIRLAKCMDAPSLLVPCSVVSCVLRYALWPACCLCMYVVGDVLESACTMLRVAFRACSAHGTAPARAWRGTLSQFCGGGGGGAASCSVWHAPPACIGQCCGPTCACTGLALASLPVQGARRRRLGGQYFKGAHHCA